MSHRPRVLFGRGVLAELTDTLDTLGARAVLFVTGRDSCRQPDITRALEAARGDRRRGRFADFATNPRLDDLKRGLDTAGGMRADAVVGIGGGSVMDMAKLIAVLAGQERRPEDYLRDGAAPERRRLPLVLVPTTAGTGSEVTPFAVVYVGRIKHSLDGPAVAADVALVDPSLTETMPRALSACCGLDALSQGVESYWAVRSTDDSRAFAREAIRLVVDVLDDACAEHPGRRARDAMARASLLAGHAIALTRTTAAHALAYPLTAHFGIPHGHACGLTLPGVLTYNAAVGDDDLADGRGVDFVRARVDEVAALLGARSPRAAAAALTDRVRRLGLVTGLGTLGVTRTQLVEAVTSGVNAARARNNPRQLTAAGLAALTDALL